MDSALIATVARLIAAAKAGTLLTHPCDTAHDLHAVAGYGIDMLCPIGAKYGASPVKAEHAELLAELHNELSKATADNESGKYGKIGDGKLLNLITQYLPLILQLLQQFKPAGG